MNSIFPVPTPAKVEIISRRSVLKGLGLVGSFVLARPRPAAFAPPLPHSAARSHR